MPLAEVFEQVAGPDAPVEFVAYDGSTAGAPGSPAVNDHGQGPDRRVLPGAGAWRARPGPGLRLRPPGRRRRHVHGAVQAGQRAADRPVGGREARAAVPARRPEAAAAAGSPPPPQEVRVNRRWLSGRRHTKGRDAERDLASLRRVQHVLRVGARPVDGLHLRVLPDAGRHPGAGAGVQVRPGRPQDRAAGRACGCSTWAAAGAAWSCTRPASTGCRRSA